LRRPLIGAVCLLKRIAYPEPSVGGDDGHRLEPFDRVADLRPPDIRHDLHIVDFFDHGNEFDRTKNLSICRVDRRHTGHEITFFRLDRQISWTPAVAQLRGADEKYAAMLRPILFTSQRLAKNRL
jgi:hypothetical protein